MSTKIKVSALTTTRADYGLLRWVLRALSESSCFSLDLLVGGAHLADAQGHSLAEIEADGFDIAALLPAAPDQDTAARAVAFAAETAVALSAALDRIRPDWLVVLGDRFEILAPVQAAVLHRVPVCHLCGGDITEGAIDDGFRHAISKLAHMHCPTTQLAAQRLRAMGEPEDRIFVTGSPGLDGLRLVPEITHGELCRELALDGKSKLICVTFHPETLSEQNPADQIAAVLGALDEPPACNAEIVFTGANIDPGGQAIMQAIERYVGSHGNTRLRRSLGQSMYFGLLRHADVVVGNSSSGLYEAPSFGVPTVNIGDRQKGRIRAESVIDCACQSREIGTAIQKALLRGRRMVANPYGDGFAGRRITEALQHMSRRTRSDVLRKTFSPLAPGR